MRQNSNNNAENINAAAQVASNNNAAALTIWDEVTISINAFELLTLKNWLTRESAEPFSDYDREKAAALLAKLATAAEPYEAEALTVWDEVTISINAFELLACRYIIGRTERRAAIWSDYDREKAAALLEKLAEAETAYKSEAVTIEDRAENVRVFHHLTAADVTARTTVAAEAVAAVTGCTLPAYDMQIDCMTFAEWVATTNEAPATYDPAAAFFFAVRKQGSESGSREHVAERCRRLGRPVYVFRVDREPGGLLRLAVKVDPAEREPLAAADELAAAPAADLTPAPADDHQDTDTTTAAEVISESEPTAAPAAGSLAGRVVTAARVFLLACCLSAADGLTAAPAGSPAADDLTPCELLTADPLAEVIRLQAAGLTVSHVTIKSTTTAAC